MNRRSLIYLIVCIFVILFYFFVANPSEAQRLNPYGGKRCILLSYIDFFPDLYLINNFGILPRPINTKPGYQKQITALNDTDLPSFINPKEHIYNIINDFFKGFAGTFSLTYQGSATYMDDDGWPFFPEPYLINNFDILPRPRPINTKL